MTVSGNRGLPYWALVFGSAVGVAAIARHAFGSSTQRAEPSTEFVDQVLTLVRTLEGKGINVKLGPLSRSPADQQTALEQGKSSTERSKHVVAQAVDVYPVDPMTGKPDLQGRNLDLYRRMISVAKGLGWKSLAFNADGSRRYLINRLGQRYWDGAHLQR